MVLRMESQVKRPNILFIFGDQHCKFDLGCYGHEFVKTPNLDKIAKGGLRFNHCISNSPVCVPARGTLLTGQFAGKHKAFTNDIPIDTTCRSIAHVLNEYGYHTGYLGKWHLAGIPREQAIEKEKRLGFTEWKVANCNHNYLDTYYYDEDNRKHVDDRYEPEVFGELAVEFIDRNSKQEQPWSLYVSFATPHEPFDKITEQYRAIYEQQDIHLRENTKEKVRYNANHFMDIEEYKELTKGYFGHITAIDDQVGEMLAKLEEVGELDNTIIMYSADHGEMLGSQGERDKQLPHEESIGIPLLAYWQNHIYQGVCDELIGLNDIPVTIASLVGTQFPNETDGVDLSNLFLEPTAKGYESAYLYDYYACHQAARKGQKAWRGIRTKQYTYAVCHDDLDWILFDNEKDPYQKENLAGLEEHRELQETLWQQLQEHIKRHDKLVSGIDYVKYSGQVEAFNISQRYFKMEEVL